ncbi:hypothetical protein HOY80DRAFT_1076801 [Tuber brumale]|nr:hypothetical protein HOY80DRAFT_1076801 [Tuber brumale]
MSNPLKMRATFPALNYRHSRQLWTIPNNSAVEAYIKKQIIRGNLLLNRNYSKIDYANVMAGKWVRRDWGCAAEFLKRNKPNVQLIGLLLREKRKNFDLVGAYTLPRAIEFIVYHARLSKMISRAGDIQQGLNELAELCEFTAILHEEVKERELVQHNIRVRIPNLALEISKHRYESKYQRTVIIRAWEYNVNDLAAIITFLKMQDEWFKPIFWREDK